MTANIRDLHGRTPSRLWLIVLAATACLRSAARHPSPPDAGVATSDAGTTDATEPPALDGGQTIRASCPPDAGPPATGGISWSAETGATAFAQSSSWVAVSDSPACATVRPPKVPAHLSWSGPDASQWAPWCSSPRLDDRG